MENEKKGNWWIWKVFWILLVVTSVEVLLGINQPEILVENRFLGTSLLNHIFIVLTLVKAGYIVLVFMHLGFERTTFKWTILIPAFILIPYLLFILLSEGGYAYFMM
ncbi:MAG TPA: cytochrome C oxidase subunit IV [Flavobacteriales bacterium]|jgi:cytochrome c oxidase subunit IV|nr:cytochrome C oxidase subunit IV [Flavobacteriales bacterium]HIL66740.1 cytochrome C oxidase subunit IV [Flavobacteriales bacterium]|tara:strand:+ start:486 stop:806 length:321 start_codon:yes stop_codon:yes gene_type:complete